MNTSSFRHLLTYGEAVYKQKEAMKMQSGEFTAPPLERYEKLNRTEAYKYYNAKLYNYWLSCIDDRFINKEAVLNYLLGR